MVSWPLLCSIWDKIGHTCRDSVKLRRLMSDARRQRCGEITICQVMNWKLSLFIWWFQVAFTHRSAARQCGTIFYSRRNIYLNRSKAENGCINVDESLPFMQCAEWVTKPQRTSINPTWMYKFFIRAQSPHTASLRAKRCEITESFQSHKTHGAWSLTQELNACHKSGW